jgi:hypothetical protein
MRKALLLTALILTVFGTSLATAQDAPRLGVVAGYPASIGILWRTSDRVAIRPEVSFNTQWSDSTSGTGTTGTVSSSGTTTSVGASLLLYVIEHDGLRPYFSPRVAYARTSTTTDAASLSGSGSHATGNTYSLAASVGAEYGLGRRFGVFGELGLVYNHQSSNLTYSGASAGGTSSGTASNFGTRTAVGVVVWF